MWDWIDEGIDEVVSCNLCEVRNIMKQHSCEVKYLKWFAPNSLPNHYHIYHIFSFVWDKRSVEIVSSLTIVWISMYSYSRIILGIASYIQPQTQKFGCDAFSKERIVKVVLGANRYSYLTASGIYSVLGTQLFKDKFTYLHIESSRATPKFFPKIPDHVSRCSNRIKPSYKQHMYIYTSNLHQNLML